jgi:hypothetical protein
VRLRCITHTGCHALGLALLRNWSFDAPDLGSAAAPPSSTVLAPPSAAAASSDIAADLFSALYIETPSSEAPMSRSPPASPTAVRRRSSLMRRASRVIDDSELVAQSLRAPQAAVREEPAAVATVKAEPTVEEEQPSKPAPAPPPRLPTMLKSSNAATQQQGAQEFSFDSFGF